MTALIQASGLTILRPGGSETVLQGVDFQIRPGEIVTVVGPNGSGKSSLVRALLGHMPLAAGRVARKPGLRIGYVPQRLAIDPTMPMTVGRFMNLPHRRDAAAIAGALDRAGLGGMGSRPLAGLSGVPPGRR